MHRLALALASIGAVVAAPTFNKDVEPVLRKHCQSCHRPGEAGPMSFITYKETRPFSAAIRQAVSTGKMPPWHADSKHGQFINERKLSAAEIATITDWAKAGAPEGKKKDLQPPVEWASGWTIGKPDVVIDMGADYKVPASGTIDYTYFVVPTNFTEDKWVERSKCGPAMERGPWCITSCYLRGRRDHRIWPRRSRASPMCRWRRIDRGNASRTSASV